MGNGIWNGMGSGMGNEMGNVIWNGMEQEWNEMEWNKTDWNESNVVISRLGRPGWVILTMTSSIILPSSKLR